MNMKNNIVFIFLAFYAGLFMLSSSIAAQPAIEWEKKYGGSNNELLESLVQTKDGGYILAGWTLSNDGDVGENKGESDIWVLKLDIEGDIMWKKNYGGTSFEEATSIQQTTDGGYIIAGRTSSNDGDVGQNNGGSDIWILKIDSIGNLLWEENYGGTEWEDAKSIQQSLDGGYIVAGRSFSSDGDVEGNNGEFDYWILKLDAMGELEWEKNYGGTATDEARSIQQTTDGGYVVAGWTESGNGDFGVNNGASDYWVLKLDNIGNLEWEMNYGGTSFDKATFIQQTIDGGYIVLGRSESNDIDLTGNNGESDCWVIKLDSNGGVEWEKNYGSEGWEEAESIQQTKDGGYVIAGRSDLGRSNSFFDCWVLKLDNVGDIEWEKTFGENEWDGAYSIQQTTDNGYVVAGYSEFTDEDAIENNGGFDYWIVKLASPFVGIQEVDVGSTFVISPNPSNGIFTIQNNNSTDPFIVNVFDAAGNNVYTRNKIKSSLNVDHLPVGLYYIEIVSEKNRHIQKLMVL